MQARIFDECREGQIAMQARIFDYLTIYRIHITFILYCSPKKSRGVGWEKEIFPFQFYKNKV